MATNPFGRPGTSVSGGQNEPTYAPSFADALRSLSTATAQDSASTAQKTMVSPANAGTLSGQQQLNPQVADTAFGVYNNTTGNALDSMRSLSTAPQAGAYGTAAQVGAALQGPAGPLGTGPSAPGAGTNAAAGSGATGLTGTAKTAFGQSFQPAAYGMAWDNPKAMIQSYFNFNKMPLHSGGLAMEQQNADSMKLLFALLNGQKPGTMDFGNYLDWAGKYMQNSMTPGGSYAAPEQVISAITHPDPKSSVFNLYYGADLTPDQQVGNVLSGLRYGLQGSMPAPVLASMLSRAQELGNNFEAWRMTHPDGGFTFGDYLRQQDPQTFGKL